MMNTRVGHADYGLVDMEESRWCYVSLGGSGSKESSSSKASGQTGVGFDNRGEAFDTLKTLLSGMTESSTQFSNTAPMLNLDSQGLTPETSNLLEQMITSGVTSQFNKLSAGGAARGQLSPKNTPGIIGSSVQRATAAALPQFLPISQQNTLFNTTSQSNTQAKGIEQLQGIASIFAALATGGSESQNKSKSKGNSGQGSIGIG